MMHNFIFNFSATMIYYNTPAIKAGFISELLSTSEINLGTSFFPLIEFL